MLALPDFSQPFIIESDASRIGSGVVFSQNQQPIAYFSHTLSPQARLKFVYERELIAVMLAIQRRCRFCWDNNSLFAGIKVP